MSTSPKDPRKVKAGKARAKTLDRRHQSAAGVALATVRGSEHMAAIGRKGAATFWSRYRMTPAGTSGWAIVRRSDGITVSTVGSIPGLVRNG